MNNINQSLFVFFVSGCNGCQCCSIRCFPLRDHTFMTYTQKGGGGVLKFVTCLCILLFLSNRSIVHFSFSWMVVGGGDGKKLVIFCGRHKWMNPDSNQIPHHLHFIEFLIS